MMDGMIEMPDRLIVMTPPSAAVLVRNTEGLSRSMVARF
jgi:hypothetical protein